MLKGDLDTPWRMKGPRREFSPLEDRHRPGGALPSSEPAMFHHDRHTSGGVAPAG